MANKGQTSVGLKDVSITVSATWQRVAAEDSGRGALLLMNVGSNSMGIHFAPMGNNNTAPTPTGIGSKGVYTLLANGSYEPDGGFIESNEIWVIGTASDNLTAHVSQAP